MRIYDGEIEAFFLGAAVSWAWTYRVMTRERRLAECIRQHISWLAMDHGLNRVQMQKADPPALISSDDILEHHRQGRVYVHQHALKKRVKVETLTGEAIVCEKFLDLTWVHAIRILLRHDGKKPLTELVYEVREEVAKDERFSDLKRPQVQDEPDEEDEQHQVARTREAAFFRERSI